MEIKNGENDFYIQEGCTVTIGKFDGVHIGHQKLIKDVVSRAKVSGIKSCVITFENDKATADESKKDAPSDKIDPVTFIGAARDRLTTFEEKKELIENLGADLLVVFKFDEALMRMNPYAFIDSILMDKLNMQSVSIGPDFRFGHKRDGKPMTFVKASMIYGYAVNVLDKEELEGKPVSSTEIRNRIREGDFETVTKMLGRSYGITGITHEGKKIGRKLGFPTMNLYPDKEKLLPPYGVYATEVSIGGRTYRSVTNVGVSPTINKNEDEVSVESHLLDFKNLSGSDYDKKIVVSFLKKIRDEKKFESEKDLAWQIANDIEARKNGT